MSKFALIPALLAAGLMTGAQAAQAASIPLTATVNSPTLTLSIAYGSGVISQTSTPPTTDSSLSGLTFPAVNPSSSTQTVTASDYVVQHATATNLTGPTAWTLAWSSAGLVNTANTADTIAPSDISVDTAFGGHNAEWTGNSTSGTSTYMMGLGSQTNGSVSSTATNWDTGGTMELDDGSGTTSIIADQPTLTIPANTPPGTYSGAITATASLQ
ncbi:hypothetical protein SAMN00768000_3078 [Sulfobacillus thermosulfidooxidans DSM 9293]|uniref:WxL domain-containing protein n=1 Tax=Sulfobacillus thermosulfidooxidans (strain DSM 9293 / VKM B-1269 / AT-1) TaxID=929705 RepID=A0A1W1WKP0_SULTA|nr:hypothetical protein [Sulfobacillus thermosulfidooxidans]SMC06884.1 hypothetical protein SAMN00768000_3078 [Sulfobacillus thermosulfidooxidans DSM 9293]